MSASIANYTVTGNSGSIVAIAAIANDGTVSYQQAHNGDTIRLSVADAASVNALTPNLLTFVSSWP